MPSIQFLSNKINPRLKNRIHLKAFIQDILKLHKKKLLQLDYVFCTDEFLLQINKDTLNHDYYTDIITFDLSSNKNELLAEIYISVDRVADNARQYNQTYTNELHRVIFHGLLHLLGFKDKTKKDAAIMRQQEDLLISQYFRKLKH